MCVVLELVIFLKKDRNKMEENVALDTSKQKQFVKSIKGIKKLIKVKKRFYKNVSIEDDVLRLCVHAPNV